MRNIKFWLESKKKKITKGIENEFLMSWYGEICYFLLKVWVCNRYGW